MNKIFKFSLTFFLISISFAANANIEPPFKNIIVSNNPIEYPDIFFKDFNGNIVNLNEEKSQFYFLNFWATWCLPCKEEMPHLDKLATKNKFQNIKIIPINIADEKLEKSKEFFEELNIINLEIFYGSSLDLAKEFKLRGIPTTIFIDKEGYEFARVIGYIDFENKSFLKWLSDYL